MEEPTSMEAQAPPLKVVIADDDPMARGLVKEALQDAGMTVIAEAKNGREAVELACYYKPDVVLMDAVMPDVDGLEATRRILKARPTVKVVVLTASDDDEIGLHAVRAGAVGFLVKSMNLDALPLALRGVHNGEAAISRGLTLELIHRLRDVRQDASGLRPVRSVLTGREWEVLDLLCAEETTEEIAAQLVLSTETVRSHVKNILRKLRVSSRAEAIRRGKSLRAEGLVPSG